MDGRTNERTNGRTKVPLCSTGLRPLRGRCPKKKTNELSTRCKKNLINHGKYSERDRKPSAFHSLRPEINFAFADCRKAVRVSARAHAGKQARVANTQKHQHTQTGRTFIPHHRINRRSSTLNYERTSGHMYALRQRLYLNSSCFGPLDCRVFDDILQSYMSLL